MTKTFSCHLYFQFTAIILLDSAFVGWNPSRLTMIMFTAHNDYVCLIKSLAEMLFGIL